MFIGIKMGLSYLKSNILVSHLGPINLCISLWACPINTSHRVANSFFFFLFLRLWHASAISVLRCWQHHQMHHSTTNITASSNSSHKMKLHIYDRLFRCLHDSLMQKKKQAKEFPSESARL